MGVRGEFRQNNVRGIFSEWLVAQLLGIGRVSRATWAAYDLTTSGGIRLEVKSAAYLQAWAQERHSQDPVFSGLTGRIKQSAGGRSSTPTYNADLYILCLQAECDPELWDALNLDQWRFWIVPRARLASNMLTSLSRQALLRSPELFGQEMSAADFVLVGRQMLASLASDPHALD